MSAPRDISFDTITDRLKLSVRIAAFFCTLLIFAVLGLLDRGIGRLWSKWCARDDAPRWISTNLVRVLLVCFPHILLLPCSWRRRYRVLQVTHPQHMHPGETGCITIQVQNISSEAWRNEEIHAYSLGVITPIEGSAFYVPDEWLDATRPATLAQETQVLPHQDVTFDLPLKAPQTPRHYQETWGLLIEAKNWLPSLDAIAIQIDVLEGP